MLSINFETFFVRALLLIVHTRNSTPFQQLLKGPMEVLLCERVNDLRHSLVHLLNFLITTASKFFLELRE